MDNWDKAILSHGMSLCHYLFHLLAYMFTVYGVCVAVIVHMDVRVCVTVVHACNVLSHVQCEYMIISFQK